MSQTTVNAAQDQWQKGQVATSHIVRDRSYKFIEDIKKYVETHIDISDPEIEVRQPDPTIVSGVCTVTSAAHGLENGQKILVANASPSTALNGEHFITVLTSDTFSFPTAAGDNTGTLLSRVIDFCVSVLKRVFN